MYMYIIKFICAVDKIVQEIKWENKIIFMCIIDRHTQQQMGIICLSLYRLYIYLLEYNEC